MNQDALEKFIVKEFLGETNYAQTDGTKWWFVVYGLAEASEWQASVDNHPAFKVTGTQSVPDEGFVIEFVFTQPPRIVYGAEPSALEAENARLRAAGLALAENAVHRDNEWGDYHCPNCGAETGYHASEDDLKHAPDCPTRVFAEGGE